MIILKLTIVPLFIAAVTMAGRRWGAGVAGLLGGFPIVAGPIVIFVAIEQGQQFGALAAVAAISAVAGLLAFGIAYAWASIRWPWPGALGCALVAWGIVAGVLSVLPPLPEVAFAVAGVSLLLTPWLLPGMPPSAVAARTGNDLPLRMLTGGLLTVAVTGTAASLGAMWSGILAVFPIIGLVLAVFTHRAQGAGPVAQMYRGMVRGLYSFAVFFLVLALLWPRAGMWLSCAVALSAGVAVQAIVQWAILPRSLRAAAAESKE
jgi:uncharacterized membrane protein (GlpM family)